MENKENGSLEQEMRPMQSAQPMNDNPMTSAGLNEGKKMSKKRKIMIMTGVVSLIAVIAIAVVGIVLNSQEKAEDQIVSEVPKEEKAKKPRVKIDKVEVTDMMFDFLALENKEENIVYSPLSIRYALAMLREGAEGDTKAQIEEVLNDATLATYDDVDATLALANALYINNSFEDKVSSEYQETLQDEYGAEVIFDEFRDAKGVNGWVKEKTLGQIPNLLNDDMVQLSKAILVNALAIDMEWAEKFDDGETDGRKFMMADGEEMEASTMTMTTRGDNVAYYEGEGVTAVALDLQEYDDQQLQFVAMMPDGNLAEYVNEYDKGQWQEVVDNLTLASVPKMGVVLHMPRFSFDYELSLKEDLQELGVVDAFDSELADLSGIYAGDEEFYVSDAVHKANIDFSEKGVKAAAASAIVMVENSAAMENEEREEPVYIDIDRPFMYAIRDKNTGEIWFVGTVYEPAKWEDEEPEEF